MKAHLEEEAIVEMIELLDFVADLCAGQPEELNVALCRFTLSYYPAHELAAQARSAADQLRTALAPHRAEALS
jgi:hypothetical protein